MLSDSQAVWSECLQGWGQTTLVIHGPQSGEVITSGLFVLTDKAPCSSLHGVCLWTPGTYHMQE